MTGIPGSGGRALLAAVGHVSGLLHPIYGPDPANDGRRLRAALADSTVRAEPSAVARAARFTQAVYVAYDAWAACRYVGSVARADDTAVAARLREHYRGAGGRAKRQVWDRLVVIGLADDLPVRLVRAAEGRVAFSLAPLDGSAHPTFATGSTLRASPAPAAG